MTKKTDLIGYCGLYCATCPGFTQIPADLAKEQMTGLKKWKLDKAADLLAKMPAFSGFKYYKQGVELLGAISKLRCQGCKKGGGSPACKIRICAKQNKFAGCWQCDKMETCKNFAFLLEDSGKTYLKNLRKIRKSGPARFVKEIDKTNRPRA
jgi:hypothetical protein